MRGEDLVRLVVIDDNLLLGDLVVGKDCHRECNEESLRRVIKNAGLPDRGYDTGHHAGSNHTPGVI